MRVAKTMNRSAFAQIFDLAERWRKNPVQGNLRVKQQSFFVTNDASKTTPSAATPLSLDNVCSSLSSY